MVESQGVDVGECFDEFLLDELIDQGGAEFIDVHLALADKVFQPLFQLGRAVWVDAAQIDSVFVFLDIAATSRARGRNLERLALEQIPLLDNDFDDLRDDLAGFFDDDGVAETGVQPG